MNGIRTTTVIHRAVEFLAIVLVLATILTVVEAGHLSPGWAPISRDQRGIYFGFVGKGPIWTEPVDSLDSGQSDARVSS